MHSIRGADRPGPRSKGSQQHGACSTLLNNIVSCFLCYRNAFKRITNRLVHQRVCGSITLKHHIFRVFIGVQLSVAAVTMNAEHFNAVFDLPRIPNDFVFEDDQLSADYFQLSREFPEGKQLTCQSESCSVAQSSTEGVTRSQPTRTVADETDDLYEKASYIDDLHPVIDISCWPKRCFTGRNWQYMHNANLACLP